MGDGRKMDCDGMGDIFGGEEGKEEEIGLG